MTDMYRLCFLRQDQDPCWTSQQSVGKVSVGNSSLQGFLLCLSTPKFLHNDRTSLQAPASDSKQQKYLCEGRRMRVDSVIIAHPKEHLFNQIAHVRKPPLT